MFVLLRKRIAPCAAILVAAFAFVSYQAQAQQEPETPAQDSASVLHPAVLASSTPEIQQVGRAGNLLDTVSPLRWGSFYIASAQYAQVFDRGSAFAGQGSFQNAASVFSSTLVFDKRFRSSRIALQYVPRVTVLNGVVLNNFTNQDTSLDTVFVLGPRWTMSFSDHFMYYRTKNAFADLYLDADSVSATTVQKNFLEGPVSWLFNSVVATFQFRLSSRTQLYASPSYVYFLTNRSAVAAGNMAAQEFIGRLGIKYSLTPRSAIQFYYNGTKDIYQGSSESSPLYQTVGVGYSRQLGAGWGIGSTFGASTVNFGTGREWTATGSFSIAKSFRRSNAALAYSRGHALSGYISSGYSDRADLSGGMMLGRRWNASAGIGYERNTSDARSSSLPSVLTSGLWGKYVLGQVSYQLLPSVSIFSSYVRKSQKGDDVQIFSGNRDYIQFGIRWSPNRTQY